MKNKLIDFLTKMKKSHGSNVNVIVESRDAYTGELIEKKEIHNKATRLWINNVAQFCAGNTSTPPGYLAVGTGTATPVDTDTALGTEIFRATLGSGNRSLSSNSCIISYTLGTADGNGNTLTEAGLFDSPTTGGGSSGSGYTQIPSTLTTMPTIYATEASGTAISTINSHLSSCPSGQCVKLAAGTFSLNTKLIIPAGKYLIGTLNGDGTLGTTINQTAASDTAAYNGGLWIEPYSLSITKCLKLSGISINDFGINPSNLLIEDIESTARDAMYDGHYTCGVYYDLFANTSGNTFRRVSVNNHHMHGFLFYNHVTSHTNYTFDHCQAIGCGIRACYGGTALNSWPCGFDFMEGGSPSVAGLTVKDCTANGNACEGFHSECSTIGTMNFDHCTASNNGQYYVIDYTTAYNNWWTGFGYLLGSQSASDYSNISFTNNAGSGNKGRPRDWGSCVDILWCYGNSGATSNCQKTGTNWNGTGSGPRPYAGGGGSSGGGNLWFRTVYGGIAKTSANTISYQWTITFN